MNKDDSDFFRYIKRDPNPGNNAALNLINGLENRIFGQIKKNVKTRENIEIFAEEQFIRKQDFDEMRCEMPGLPRSTFLMVFSPDGSRVASTHGNHNIYITDIRTGKHIRTLVGHPRTPWCIAFHPTSDQIVASGCLGGQVRIWDLSGGSEVWTTENQNVIASLAFHPTDRVLVIATYNELYFWDWSQPEPFVHVATSNPKERVRFVAFDSLGHKLITGIANGPQTSWGRVRAPVPVSRQERSVSPYRRRITQRLVNSIQFNQPSPNNPPPSQESPNTSEPLSNVPERVRRITVCYRNLVREYEQLVQRYLQLYRPPTMIDRGTDPMEPFPQAQQRGNNNENPGPSTSNSQTESEAGPQPGCSKQDDQRPSTSCGTQTIKGAADSLPSQPTERFPLVAPSRIFSVINKPSMLIRGTQTSESRKHKAEPIQTEPKGKRLKKSSTQDDEGSSRDGAEIPGPSSSYSQPQTESDTQPSSTRKFVVINLKKVNKAPSSDRLPTSSTPSSDRLPTNSTPSSEPSTSGFRIRIPLDRDTTNANDSNTNNTDTNIRDNLQMNPEGRDNLCEENNYSSSNVDELLHNIRRTAEEEVRNRILPIIRSVPATDRPELIRLFENSREHVRRRFRQMYPAFIKKNSRRNLNVVDTTSDSSSSDEDNSNPSTVCPTRRNSSGSLNNQNPTVNATNASTSNVASSNSSSSSTVRNFNTELEQLVTSLLTEIERNETEGTTSNSNPNVNTQTARNDSPEGNSTAPEGPTQSREEPSSLPPASSSTQTDMSLPPYSPPSPRFFQYYLHRPRPSEDIITRENGTPTGLNSNPNSAQPNSLNYVPRRRRFSLHRMSAFMPTRVHYQRLPSRIRRPTHTLGRGRLGLRSQGPIPFENDELINFSEREHSEEESPSQPLDLSNHTPPETGNTGNMYSNIRLGSVYSNIIHDLENSLSDVIRMRTSNRPGETSDMLGSFSERLENIMQQSDMILRNLSNSVEMLSNSTEPNTLRPQGSEPSWSFFDQNFYIRDQRTENTSQESNREDTINLSDIFNSRPPFNSATSDHTYPRNPENADASSQSENIRPLMTSIHMTISHIQRQARLLRRQVEIIERIDRAMLEVAQLQLIRQLIIELVRHMRTVSGERHNTGVSSVRQMMAGTRISDSSPYESPAEDASPQPNAQSSASSSTSNTGEQSSSSGTQTRPPRSSNRKTYPPGRLLRRRSSIINFFSRRYNRSERNARSTLVDRNVRNPFTPRATYEPLNNYSYVNPNTLAYMTRRLQHLLMEQVRMLTPAAPSDLPHIIGRRTAVAVGEHMLVARLHGCVLRVNRLTGRNTLPNPQENLRRDPAAAVTPDGESRYRARHTLSMIVECISRHIEELGYPSIPPSMRQQLHGVLVMSLLLTELLLLVIVDSIPPPTGINLIPERASLTSRIDHIVNQLLQSRFSHSHQLTRSLRLMKLTMRHAQSALDETYRNRRNEMLPRVNTNRRQVLGSISRCLRFINRQREASNTEQQNTPSTSNVPEPEPSSSSNPNPAGEDDEEGGEDTIPESNDHNGEWYSNIYDFFLRRYTNNRDEDADNQPSTSNRDRIQQNDVSSTNDNTDGEDDETDGYNNNYIPRTSSSYRTNNVNVGLHVNVGGGPGSGPPPRPWNVPAVQVNDVPVFEPSTIAQRIITQRQRFAERVSELRSNPTMGLFRPRFLHPLYASVMNPFDADLDDPQREPLYDSDMITTVTPNHRIQAWDVSDWTLPVPEISDALKNVVVGECKIHNDASVDVAKDGTILVTLLPSGGYLNVTNRLGVYSLKWETLGQCLYTASFEQNAVSVSLSPLSRHLVVGLTHRIITSDRWVMARVFRIDQKDVPGDRLPVIRELEQSRDSRINCIRWLPTSGQGLIYATNTGQLVVLS